jgi:hypothetical protein
VGNLVALRGEAVSTVDDALHDLRASGLVRTASTPVDDIARFLPVQPQLARLLPGGGLRRGSTVAVSPGGVGTGAHGTTGTTAGAPGATTLLLSLIATASAEGAWCAVVGLPDLGMAAAAEAGVALSRFALVPRPGPDWAGVVAALLDGVDIVVAATPGPVRATVTGRLAARARQRGSVLVPYGRWDGVDLTLAVTGGDWHGLGLGRGRLRLRELDVTASGRGAATLTRRTRLTLPAESGLGRAGRASAPVVGEVAAEVVASGLRDEDAA